MTEPEHMTNDINGVGGRSEIDAAYLAMDNKGFETEDEATRSLEREDMFIIVPIIMDDLSKYDASAYDAMPIRSKDYVSKDVVPLTKDEVRAILKKDGLI